VPPTVLTVIFTVPTDPDGASNFIVVDVSDISDVTTVVPKFTCVAFAKFVPLIVTVPPPDTEPADGLTEVTFG
jgi:hypothetical protein